ncbi:ASCH/PUA domain-containing protein [Cohnella sp.]|uniref:ASCH/PUA domain-containing protein n=1 Tax=Cohnella sp. TaxID=1883426 RepID=UPI00370377F7
MRHPKTHVLKCWTQYYQAVKSGAKPFEIRLNDRDYQVGDTLILKEFKPFGEAIGGGYLGDGQIVRTITYMTDFEQQPGYVVLGIPDQSESTRLREALRAIAESKDQWYVGRVSMQDFAAQALSSSHGEGTGIREPVTWFSGRMESRLLENDHKGGWDKTRCSMDFLLEQMDKKCRRFVGRHGSGETTERLIDLLADIANYAMMQADRLRTIPGITEER